MNGVLRLAALLLILYGVKSAIGSFAFAQDPSSVSFVGRWRSLETSKGGIGQFCDFRPDGKVDFGVGADVEMPWRIENGQLILPSETNGGPERKASLKWFGRNRIHIEGGAAPIELVRVGDPINPNDPLLGEWIENRDMGGQKLIAR